MFVKPIFSVSLNNQYYRKLSGRQSQNNYAATTFTGDDGYFDYDARLKEKLEARTGWQKFWGRGKKKARKETESELIGFSMQQDRLISQIKSSLKDKERLVEKEKEKAKVLQEKYELLQQQLHDAEVKNEQKNVILKLQQEIEDLKNAKEVQDVKTASEVDKLNRMKAEQEILTRRERDKGWNRIAGYDVLKTQMEEAFINKLAAEKAGYEVNMPNGILLYGQHGTGKTRFAEAFAQQAGCNFVEINTMQDNDDILDDVQSELKKSKKSYAMGEVPRTRTIILLDDFNAIAHLNDSEKRELENKGIDFEDTSVGQLADALRDSASKYKATIFMTTNHPRKIDSELLSSQLIPYQIFLGPPNPYDAAQIFKYHVNDFTNQDIDYNKLGNEVAKAILNDEAYSAQGIVNIVDYAKEKAKGAELTEADLIQAIEHVKPDITPKTFNAFLDDMSELLAETVKKNESDEV